jgi:glucosamine--fructose-6-phosphate aminotransferase (isomerizing)
VRELIGKNGEGPFSQQLIQEFRKVNFILNNLDRLEVRGRDSAGLSIMVTFPDTMAFQAFLGKLSKIGLDEQLKERQRIPDTLNRHVFYNAQTITFTFKVCAEIGKLGDNIAALRRIISQDTIFPLAVQEEEIFRVLLILVGLL